MSILKIETPRALLPLLGHARYKGARGGRGGGKSHFFAELLIEEAIASHQRVACLREIQNSIKDSVKRLIEDKIAKLGVGNLFNVTDSEIRGPNESLFIFRGLQNHTAATIKSLEGFTRAWIEEAQTISQRSLDIMTPTFRTPGAEMMFSWNPNRQSDPIERLFLGNEGDPNFILVNVDYADNPWFSDELRADMERDKRRDPDKYAHIWLGEYERSSEARVFRNWIIGDLVLPEGAVPRFGADWGFSVDPTVLIRCWLIGDRQLYVDREIYRVGCEIDATPALFDRMNDARTPDVRKWPIRADSARPETISYLAKRGFNIQAARKGPGSIEEGVTFLQSVDITVRPDCKHTIDELSLYSYKTDKLTNEVIPELEDKKNHVIDALRYSLEGARRAVNIPFVVPIVVGQPRHNPW